MIRDGYPNVQEKLKRDTRAWSWEIFDAEYRADLDVDLSQLYEWLPEHRTESCLCGPRPHFKCERTSFLEPWMLFSNDICEKWRLNKGEDHEESGREKIQELISRCQGRNLAGNILLKTELCRDGIDNIRIREVCITHVVEHIGSKRLADDSGTAAARNTRPRIGPEQ